MNHFYFIHRTVVVLALCIGLSACAGIDRPVAELNMAEASIDEAERSGGQEYGAVALESARDKLSLAQRAAENDENEEALSLATEAEADAKLAQAQADRGKSAAALQKIQDGLGTLHRETLQGE